MNLFRMARSVCIGREKSIMIFIAFSLIVSKDSIKLYIKYMRPFSAIKVFKYSQSSLFTKDKSYIVLEKSMLRTMNLPFFFVNMKVAAK